jgi:hypothetical protein
VAASVASEVRAVVAAAPVGTFIRSTDIPGSRAAVNTALSRLSSVGDVVRLRHGLYWKGVKSRFGAGRPALLDGAIAAAGTRGVGPSGWSAAQALGLSTQIPATPEVAVAGPAPSYEGVIFHKRNNLARRELGVWEIAILEVLRAYPAYVEATLDEVAERVSGLVEDGKVRLADVERAVSTERSPTLRHNLAAVRAKLSAAHK